ncbi:MULTISPECIES: hypothetical protein [unclassified Stenotrophomonas]|uniref:hypothetical protein n=1 Tax=unclassified Stenotrophomonas TaxID=196198 RepID=UPI00244B648C|nr:MULTISPECIES: hypothetical protein [unclassified Stenotrophomonas]MDH0277289.1 hypothetical protein [Stenotrophomonas sp. GD04089]MDH1911573.1 hypothetical protein [Stenotrophomonas sp. GD03794]
MRKPIPPNATARDLVRRYVHEDGKSLGELSTAWGCKPFSVWRVFQRTDRPLQPHHVEGAITALQLDEFDANELRLRAAREAGWKIDPFYLGTDA